LNEYNLSYQLQLKPNILVVCGRNKRRSKTAEVIFRNETSFKVKGVGLSPKSPSQISETKINWANAILVMEDGHKERVLSQYRHINLPPICVLHIEDEYGFMHPELINILEDRIPEVLKHEIG